MVKKQTFTEFIAELQVKGRIKSDFESSFVTDFQDMIDKDGCWIHYRLLEKYGLYKFRDSYNFQQILKKNYIENEDYTIAKVNGKGPGAPPSIEYYLSSECFKHICMKCQNKRGKRICQYFIDLEKCVKWYQEYKQLNCNDFDLSIMFKTLSVNVPEEIDEPVKAYVYIMTTPEYKNRHIYKIGFSKDVKKRFKQLQTGNIQNYLCVHQIYVFDAQLKESNLHMDLGFSRIRREFFCLPPNFLEIVIKMMNAIETNESNDNMTQLRNQLKQNYIPQRDELNDLIDKAYDYAFAKA